MHYYINILFFLALYTVGQVFGATIQLPSTATSKNIHNNNNDTASGSSPINFPKSLEKRWWPLDSLFGFIFKETEEIDQRLGEALCRKAEVVAHITLHEVKDAEAAGERALKKNAHDRDVDSIIKKAAHNGRIMSRELQYLAIQYRQSEKGTDASQRAGERLRQALDEVKTLIPSIRSARCRATNEVECPRIRAYFSGGQIHYMFNTDPFANPFTNPFDWPTMIPHTTDQADLFSGPFNSEYERNVDGVASDLPDPSMLEGMRDDLLRKGYDVADEFNATIDLIIRETQARDSNNNNNGDPSSHHRRSIDPRLNPQDLQVGDQEKNKKGDLGLSRRNSQRFVTVPDSKLNGLINQIEPQIKELGKICSSQLQSKSPDPDNLAATCLKLLSLKLSLKTALQVFIKTPGLSLVTPA